MVQRGFSSLRRWLVNTEENWRIHTLFLFVVTLLTRLAFRSNYLYDHDSVQFALGLRSYDVYLHQPHPPGYFLYVLMGRLIDYFFHDANTSLVWISTVASAATVSVIYNLGNAIFDHHNGWWTALIALTSPLFWFFGEVALTYTLAAFFSSLVALGAWRVLHGENRWIYPLSFILGVSAGFRQDLGLFLAPLWLFALTRTHFRVFISACLLLVLTVIAWFIPMLIASGGATRYFAATSELWQFNNAPQTIWNAALTTRLDTLLTLLGVLFYGVGVASIFLLFAAYILIQTGRWRMVIANHLCFFVIWLAPALLFFILVFIPPFKYSYGLVVLPAFILLIPAAIRQVSSAASNIQQVKTFVRAPAFILSLVVISNAVLFCFSMSGFSLTGLRSHERILSMIFTGIKRNFPAKGTLILGRQRSTFSGFRHVQYYLPDYRVYLVDQQRNVRGEQWYAFGARDGKTLLSRKVEVPADTERIIYLADPYFPESNADLKTMNLQSVPLSGNYRLYYKILQPAEATQPTAPPPAN